MPRARSVTSVQPGFRLTPAFHRRAACPSLRCWGLSKPVRDAGTSQDREHSTAQTGTYIHPLLFFLPSCRIFHKHAFTR